MRKVIDPDQVEESVRRFMEHLEPSKEASVFQAPGKKVYLVVRADIRPTKPEGRWTKAKNNRRCELIEKEIDEKITPEEVVELDDLTQQMRRHINRVAPLPIAALERALGELVVKATKGAGDHES
jgi:hypothetical protein